jgi:hypothetical protein
MTTMQLLEAVGQRLSGPYLERMGDPAVSDVRELFELCQQQRLLIEQWEELCKMRCKGAVEIAEMVRSVAGGQD